MRPKQWQPSTSFFHESNFPLTKIIIGCNLLSLVLTQVFHLPVQQWLAFISPEQFARPWTLLTYPLFCSNHMEVLFNGLALYYFCSSLERSWGTRTYGMYFGAMSIVSALGIALGASLLGLTGMAANWLPITALIMTFCVMNPDEEIVLVVFPMRARWLMYIEVFIVFFLHAGQHPLMGFFGLTGCAAAYVWTRWKLKNDFNLYMPVARKPRRQKPAREQQGSRDDAFSWRDLNPFEWLARRRRRKQFMRLMDDDK